LLEAAPKRRRAAIGVVRRRVDAHSLAPSRAAPIAASIAARRARLNDARGRLAASAPDDPVFFRASPLAVVGQSHVALRAHGTHAHERARFERTSGGRLVRCFVAGATERDERRERERRERA
jgi:hypothetical protein